MSDLELHARWDFSDIDDGLAAVAHRGKDFSPFFRREKTPAKRHQREHGRRREGPDGRWPKWSSAYRRARRQRRRRGRKNSTRMLGKLTRSHRTQVDAFGIRLESPIEWADAHQQTTRVGRGAKLSARPFLWWADDYVDDFSERALDFAWGVW